MTQEEIVNLAGLVQIEVSPEEAADLIPKMDSVLGYIDQIKSIEIKEDSLESVDPDNFALRSDIPEISDFKDKFIGQAPNSENDLIKVVKVLASE